jgi:hypothetical protein
VLKGGLNNFLGKLSSRAKDNLTSLLIGDGIHTYKGIGTLMAGCIDVNKDDYLRGRSDIHVEKFFPLRHLTFVDFYAEAKVPGFYKCSRGQHPRLNVQVWIHDNLILCN